MSTKTLEQTRAEFTYKCVEQIANDDKDTIQKKKFKGLVKKTPTYILTNGLGNTLAFLFSKGNNEHLALAFIIGKYLFEINEYTQKIFNFSSDIFNIKLNEFVKDENFIGQLRNTLFQNLVFTDTEKYILATEETLRLLNWLKRFAEAMIEGEE
jgi:CRISPR-associated protein Cmr5